jgi:hypothetical protein
MKEAPMTTTIAKLLTGSVLVATILTVSISAEAGVRDHRANSGGTYSTNTPPPTVNRPGQTATDRVTSNGGVTVTSRPRAKKEKVCLLVVPGNPCTSNQSAVDAAKWAKGQK